MRKHSRGLLAMLAVLALVVAACGDGGTGESTTTTGPAPNTTEAGTATTEAGVSTTAAPSGEPIKIGMLADLTSTFTPWGVNVRDGMLLAAEEINATGGVDGRMIEIVQQDSENDPDVAATAWDRLIEEGVVAVGGILSSGVAPTAAQLAEADQVPVFFVKAGTPVSLTQDTRYAFRTCLPAAPMDAAPILQYAQEQGLTNVGVIVADYAWGQGFAAAVEDTFAGSGIDYGEIQVAPVPPDSDFTPFVRNMADAGAQMVIATGHPPGGPAIVGLSADLIGDVPVTGAWTPPDRSLALIDPATAIGRFADFACADYTSDSYADLAARYLAFSDNAFMSDDAVAAYGIVTMVAEAVGAVGDDPVAIDEYLHDNEFELEGYAHTMSWTDWGELAAAQPIFFGITEGPPPDGLNEAGDWWIEVLSQSEPLEPYVPES
ncbi:MAG TPA: ABC transporter substrate-binding protein [Acidimicrobiia bacterium]|nr:ABC transporter substrate-binding protein [Acidimicrobiia bacterium]